jgi:multiple sugar transport system substrate-binding protein
MAPDLVMPVGVMGVATYQEEWLDIAPYIKKDNYDLSDFYGTSLDTFKFGDKVIGIPFGVYPSVIAYNADLQTAGALMMMLPPYSSSSWPSATSSRAPWCPG